MRSLTILAWIIGGLPVAAFFATLALTNGAPIRAPSAGSEAPAEKIVTPDSQGKPALAIPAGIPTHALIQAKEEVLPTAADWRPPPAAEFRYDRTRAGWDRLELLATSGDRDALVFLTLMRSGTIPGNGRVNHTATP